jgi:hypothetical protein
MNGPGKVPGRDVGMAAQFMFRGIAMGVGVGMAVLFIVFCFTAYLDPAVFVPALNAFSFCG